MLSTLLLASAALLVPVDRVLFRSGAFATRAEARRALLDGRVSCCTGEEGVAVAIRQNAAHDPSHKLLLDRQPLPPPPPTVVIALHKPQGVLCTRAPEDTSLRRRREGRERSSVYDHLRAHGLRDAAELRCLAPVGRLDADSEGLLLLTNDGTLAQCLLAQGSIEKRYLAAVSPRGAPNASRAQLLQRLADSAVRMERGVALPGGTPSRAVRAAAVPTADAAGGGAAEGLAEAAALLVEVSMAQGAKREVRRLLKEVGWRTVRLCRVAIGPLALGCLRPGQWRALSQHEVCALYRCVAPQLGGLVAYNSTLGQWVPATEMVSADVNARLEV